MRGTFITSKLVFCASPMHPTREMEHGQHRHGVLRNSNPQNMGHSTAGRSREPAGWGSAGHVYVELWQMHLITLRPSSSLTIVGLVQLAITALSVSRRDISLPQGDFLSWRREFKLHFMSSRDISVKKSSI